jgi:NAD(P)-dependent dehydrogenase (short-subunit alcohol dehydrogenase family)
MASAPDLDFSGRVVLVTGGSKGIGAGVAEAFVRAGATVDVVGRDEADGAATAGRLEIGLGTCRSRSVDVADFDALRAAIADTAATHGRLDVMVNNAAYFPGWQPIDDVSDDTLLRALRTNVGAYVVGSQAALPHLRRSGGSIVNIGSVSGELGGWHDAVYSSTKGAIASFTRALAVEEAGSGVRVNVILPGNIVTEARHRSVGASDDPDLTHRTLERWQWLGRSGTVGEVGDAALFLASPMASFCTGISLVVSGGLELGYGAKVPYPELEPRSTLDPYPTKGG